MNTHHLSRRQFYPAFRPGCECAVFDVQHPGPACQAPATDQVPLGETGLRLSRLGCGTGSNSGNVQKALGQENFNRLVRYAYDQGITYFDCAQSYQTFEWIKGAVKGLPREKIFIQSKIGGKPEDVLAAIDRHRKVFDTDYVDSMLIHCMVKDGWTGEWQRIMDAFDEAKQKQWIRAKGVSCHSLPALRAATASPWTEVHLVRVNPQAKHVDGAAETWDKPGQDLSPVMTEVKAMHTKGRGVIGMKIIGNGDFTQPEDREKSIRFAMSCPDIDSIVIGFKSTAKIDGLKVQITEIPIPVAYGPAFEGERVRKEDVYLECGGGKTPCFEWARIADMDAVEDGKVTVIGPDLKDIQPGSRLPLGVVVDVAGRKMQEDYEPILERQIHHLVNYAQGVMHIGQRDIAWYRIGKQAVEKGFTLEHIGKLLHAKFHQDFGAMFDKCQVTIYTDQDDVEKLKAEAQQAYHVRDARVENMTDETIETYYSSSAV